MRLSDKEFRSAPSSICLSYDFTGGGAYVGISRDLRDVSTSTAVALSFRAKTTADVTPMFVRLTEATGQTHQSGVFSLKKTGDWQKIALPLEESSFPHSWGGANDKKIHFPLSGVFVGVNNSVVKTGKVYIDDLAVSVQDIDIRFEPVEPSERMQANAAGTLEAHVRLRVLSKGIQEPTPVLASLQLTLDGVSIREERVELTVLPGKDAVSARSRIDIPFDMPGCECELRLTGLKDADGRDAVLKLGTVSVQGRYPSPAPRSARIPPPEIQGPERAKAGAEWTFSVRVTPNTAVSDPPRRMVVLVELAPHVAYVAESFDLPASPREWPAAQSRELGPFALRLPADLPGGRYTVRLGFVNEAYVGREPNDLDVGELVVTGSATRETTGLKPMSHGTYVDNRGVPQMWYSTPSHALVWNGEPFLPVSGMWSGDYLAFGKTPGAFEKFKAKVSAIRAAGLDHLYLTTQGAVWTCQSRSNAAA